VVENGATAAGVEAALTHPQEFIMTGPPRSGDVGRGSRRSAGETAEASVIRGIAGSFVIAGVVAAAVFLADRPGRVDIVWQGWQVETSVGVLVAAAIISALVIWMLLSVLGLIISSPRRMLRSRQARRRRAGYRALA
jgi:hypothetical protein